jgi:type IV pilus assembly protein PilA
MAGLSAGVNAWNLGFVPTKYVTNIQANNATGVITVTYNGAYVPQIAGMTILLSPFINKVALGPGQQGAIDWACTSLGNATATARGMGAAVTGTLTQRFAPAECK